MLLDRVVPGHLATAAFAVQGATMLVAGALLKPLPTAQRAPERDDALV